MATIMDVAKKVGVSKSTVSKALNGNGRVSKKTQRAIIQAAQELNYRPNALAQSLSLQSTNTIGLIIPKGYSTSQYITRLIDIAYIFSRNAGKSLMITQMDGNDLHSGINAIRYLVDRCCEGILYYKNSHIDNVNIEKELSDVVRTLDIPLVMLNYQLSDFPQHSVFLDPVLAAKLAVDYLIHCGHRRIAYISGGEVSRTSLLRQEGYRQAMEAANLEIEPAFIIVGDGHYKGGYDGGMRIVKNGLTVSAVACFNDKTAVGLLHAFNKNGISVPNEVSIIGFDNEDVIDFVSPPITSIALPADNMVSYALTLLFGHMKLIPLPDCNEVFQGELIVRESVKTIVL